MISSTFRPFRAPKVNPFEFEPSTPYNDPDRQTMFTDFIKKGQDAPSPLTPRSAHVKNTRSEENATRITQDPAHLAVTPKKPNGHALYRSESSPNISQLPFTANHSEAANSEILSYYTEAYEVKSLGRGSQEESQGGIRREGQNVGVKYGSPSRQHQVYAQERPSRSPTRHPAQASFSRGHNVSRSMTRSPTKTLDDVSEREEYNGSLPTQDSDIFPASPKKRSRSPMKKMFGENGWLGKSPDEKPDLKPSKKAFVTHMDFAHRPKKVGMMEKLKNKFDEIVSRR